MTRLPTARPLPLTGVLLGLLLPAAATVAQDGPDIRNIRPVVMLLVDTSGSMERLPGCECTTPACRECEPACSGVVGSDELNRFTTILEAMTGGFTDFSCERQVRSGPGYSGEYDEHYFIPHFARDPAITQIEDGILDAYQPRAKFGLMTFDGQPTFHGSPVLVTEGTFLPRIADSESEPGMFSFGERKPFTFPNCGSTHMMDNGARAEGAGAGALISVGSDATADFAVINQSIQSSLLGVRPFGGTPIAGMLDDFTYYLNNHPDVKPFDAVSGLGDPFYECRSRYAILLTDGAPNGDMREYGCDLPGYSCPYELPETLAGDLCQYNGLNDVCTGILDGLFVVGFSVDDPDTMAILNDIAQLGGTEEALFADDRATLMSKLSFALNQIASGTTTRNIPAFNASGLGSTSQLQAQFNAGFRVATEDGDPWEGVIERRRFECNASLEPEAQTVDAAENDLFHEVLNGQTLSPAASEISACPAGMPRCLLTVLPADPTHVNDHLAGDDEGIGALGAASEPDGGAGIGAGGPPTGCVGGGGLAAGSATPAETGLTLTGFSTANAGLTNGILGAATGSERDEIIEWVHGLPGTVRENKRLGDIYHSSPAVVGPPEQDLPDESFNLFRQRPEVVNRPTVLYVGSNDGILHAFVVQDTTITEGPHAGTTLTAGQELWGFIPPILLNKLKSAKASHQWMVDGTPIVKDMFFKRLPGQAPDGTLFRTVLIMGFRGGAAGYLALDVTDPLAPKFLWQYRDPRMGLTYGEPALAQVLVEGSSGLEERGIAILPGGLGSDLTGSSPSCGAPPSAGDPPVGCTPTGMGMPDLPDGVSGSPRTRTRCWDVSGRQLFFVDLATGERIGDLDDQVFNAPLTGGVSLFTGDVGTIATRGFVSDHDGVLWRIDMASTDIGDWTARPFHDLFYDGNAVAGQPAYNPPVVTTDNEGAVVILQATGDLDDLDGLAANRVVSLTEQLTFAATGDVTDTAAGLNWEIKLETAEQVTGPLELFDGRVFFATFTAVDDPTSACTFGHSRIWGVEYLDTVDVGVSTDFDCGAGECPAPALEVPDPVDPAATTLAHHSADFDNQVIFGVSVTQRPRCIDLSDVSETDPFLGNRSLAQVNGAGGGQFEMVALTSGDGQAQAGGTVSELSQELPPPTSVTAVRSFAGTVF